MLVAVVNAGLIITDNNPCNFTVVMGSHQASESHAHSLQQLKHDERKQLDTHYSLHLIEFISGTKSFMVAKEQLMLF